MLLHTSVGRVFKFSKTIVDFHMEKTKKNKKTAGYGYLKGYY
jgi:hypothetical protein